MDGPRGEREIGVSGRLVSHEEPRRGEILKDREMRPQVNQHSFGIVVHFHCFWETFPWHEHP